MARFIMRKKRPEAERKQRGRLAKSVRTLRRKDALGGYQTIRGVKEYSEHLFSDKEKLGREIGRFIANSKAKKVKIFDVGMGLGKALFELKQRFGERVVVSGITLQKLPEKERTGMIEALNAMVTRHRGVEGERHQAIAKAFERQRDFLQGMREIKTHVGRMERFKFAGKQDVIMSTYAFIYSSNPVKVLEKICNSLSLDGRAYLENFDYLFEPKRLAEDGTPIPHGKPVKDYKAVIERLKRNGFEVKRLARHNYRIIRRSSSKLDLKDLFFEALME